jgi:hypothetical protein
MALFLTSGRLPHPTSYLPLLKTWAIRLHGETLHYFLLMGRNRVKYGNNYGFEGGTVSEASLASLSMEEMVQAIAASRTLA